MHWYKLVIHWIGPVCNRPDVAYIWRMRPEGQPALEQWELELIREHYPYCTMEFLLTRMPNRTWKSMIGAACDMGVQREQSDRGKGRRAIPNNLAWEDISFFSNKEKAIAMAREATEECVKHGIPLYARWLVDLPYTNGLTKSSKEDIILP